MVNSVFSDFLHEPDSPHQSCEAEKPSQNEIQQVRTHGETGSEDRKSIASSYCGSVKRISESPYHVFSKTKKRQLVCIVSLAGLLSPLSSNIYFPALYAISLDMGAHIALVSLTITIYMVVQGLAPSFWGPLSDVKGRRITLMGTSVVYLVSNIGLALSRDLVSLMVFRGIQAAGSAATISIGAGVIGDVTTTKERGGFLGTFGGIRMMGQSIGPVLGGVLTEFFGFRSIFWFLFALGAVTLLLILFALPETLRYIAGNGSVPLHGVHRPLVYRIRPQKFASAEPRSDRTPPPRLTVSSLLSPLRFLLEKDVFVTLLFGAAVYTVWSMMGLAFLPNGAGCVAGSLLTGHLLDRDYRILESEYRSTKNLPADAKLNQKELVDFPVARSRLRSAWYLAALFIGAVSGYGFSVSSPTLIEEGRIAVPLLLQFVIAYTATGMFTQNSALVVDLYPGASASATAVNNLMRCIVGAAGVAAVQFMIDGMGAGITFLVLALMTAALTPLLWAELVWGEKWRKDRMKRIAKEEADREAVDAGEGGLDRVLRGTSHRHMKS